jgi:hypothetical protein
MHGFEPINESIVVVFMPLQYVSILFLLLLHNIIGLSIVLYCIVLSKPPIHLLHE